MDTTLSKLSTFGRDTRVYYKGIRRGREEGFGVSVFGVSIFCIRHFCILHSDLGYGLNPDLELPSLGSGAASGQLEAIIGWLRPHILCYLSP